MALSRLAAKRAQRLDGSTDARAVRLEQHGFAGVHVHARAAAQPLQGAVPRRSSIDAILHSTLKAADQTLSASAQRHPSCASAHPLYASWRASAATSQPPPGSAEALSRQVAPKPQLDTVVRELREADEELAATRSHSMQLIEELRHSEHQRALLESEVASMKTLLVHKSARMNVGAVHERAVDVLGRSSGGEAYLLGDAPATGHVASQGQLEQWKMEMAQARAGMRTSNLEQSGMRRSPSNLSAPPGGGVTLSKRYVSKISDSNPALRHRPSQLPAQASLAVEREISRQVSSLQAALRSNISELGRCRHLLLLNGITPPKPLPSPLAHVLTAADPPPVARPADGASASGGVGGSVGGPRAGGLLSTDLSSLSGRDPEEIEWAQSLTAEQRQLAQTSGVHPGIACDQTGMCPIIGYRYTLRDKDYDLCQEAYDHLPPAEQTPYTKVPPPVKWKALPPAAMVTAISPSARTPHNKMLAMDAHLNPTGSRTSLGSARSKSSSRLDASVMRHAPREELQTLVDLALEGAQKARADAKGAQEVARRCRKEALAAKQAARTAEARATKLLGACACFACGRKLDEGDLRCDSCRAGMVQRARQEQHVERAGGSNAEGGSGAKEDGEAERRGPDREAEEEATGDGDAYDSDEHYGEENE